MSTPNQQVTTKGNIPNELLIKDNDIPQFKELKESEDYISICSVVYFYIE